MNLQAEIFRYRYKLGMSLSEIEKMTNIDKSTLCRWLGEKNDIDYYGKYTSVVNSLCKEGIKDKILQLLLFTTKEKGISKTISYYKIWQVYKEYLCNAGISSITSFYRFMDFLIKKEFGSIEKLEMKRRPKEEKNKYRSIKGNIKREIATFEIDATGYTFQENTYFILLVKEIYSGYIFEPFVLQAKEETGAKFYNKAINSYDVAKLLMTIFSNYGIPKIVKTDNDLTMNNNLLLSAFNELGIKVEKTKAYSPQSKLIERTIRDIKAWIRIKESIDFSTTLISAINSYNNTEHNFIHISGKVKPIDLIDTIEFEKVSVEKIKRAFCIKLTRKVINNIITIDNDKYYFIYKDFDINLELGRNKEYPTVLVRKYLDDNSLIEIYDENSKYLGNASLISGSILSPLEIKQEKNKEKRIIRRKEKLYDELEKIEKAQNENNNLTIDRESEFNIKDTQKIDDDDNEFDPLKLFAFN
ncbi:MAG: hypothetical protein NZZ41_03235 [Candidatus Dojkabacteria bacterium]|nr:hypothetical protein [Candidatus Dojkabacteria bacterium]